MCHFVGLLKYFVPRHAKLASLYVHASFNGHITDLHVVVAINVFTISNRRPPVMHRPGYPVAPRAQYHSLGIGEGKCTFQITIRIIGSVPIGLELVEVPACYPRLGAKKTILDWDVIPLYERDRLNLTATSQHSEHVSGLERT
jgi:hypothetical protein